MMSRDAKMKLCSKSSRGATPSFIRITPLFIRPHLLWGRLVSRCCLSLHHHLLTSTPLWTCEMPCNTTAGPQLETWPLPEKASWHFEAQPGPSSENVAAPHSCTFRGSSALWSGKNRGGCNRWWPGVLRDYWTVTNGVIFKHVMLSFVWFSFVIGIYHY